jgi:hypothetical protein
LRLEFSRSRNPSGRNCMNRLKVSLLLLLCTSVSLLLSCVRLAMSPIPRALLMYMTVDSFHKLGMNMRTLACF